MDQLDFAAGVELAFDAIVQDRLAFICGAGLSMAGPSNIPSAWTVASSAKREYDAIYGMANDPLSEDIEEQAEFFHEKGQLATTYLTKLIDNDTFSAPPNNGHLAVADFLLTKAAQIAVSTNVDALIESAGDQLFGGVVTATRRDDAAAFYPENAPLLKIHGCWKSDRRQTVWAPSQLLCEPNQSRVAECSLWMEQQLLNRDLIIIGYFTDWDYLNALLERCLGSVQPSNVFVVDPSSTADLNGKAPALFSVGENAAGGFYHVQGSGADFLHELRKKWSVSYLRQVLSAGFQLLQQYQDPRADMANCEPPEAEVEALWAIRRDLEGVGPNDPCRTKKPYDDPTLGRMLHILRHGGANLEGTHWNLNGRKIRVIRGSGKALNEVAKAHEGSVSPLSAADITIATGARDFGLKPDIARSGTLPSVVRNQSSRFLTDEQAEQELGI